MLSIFKSKLYNSVEKDPIFKVTYLTKKVKLILTDEYIKIGKDLFKYSNIPYFGYKNKIFYFTTKTNEKEILRYVKYSKPYKIFEKIYKKCEDLVEIHTENNILDSIPDPPDYEPYILSPDYSESDLSDSYEEYPHYIFEPR